MPHPVIRNRRLYSPSGFNNPQATDWVSRVIANGGSVSPSTATAADNFWSAIVAAGIDSKILRLNLYAGTGLAACAVPFINTKGSTLDTLSNFVAGDYSESTGLTGDGSTKFVATGFTPGTDWTSVNDMSIGAYSRTDSIETNNSLIGATSIGDAASQIYMTVKISLAGNQTYCLLSGANLAIAGDGTTLGLYHGSRTGSGLVLYKNGASFATNAGASGNLNAPTIKVHCESQTGGTPEAIFTAKTLAGYVIALGMTGTQALAFYNAFQGFQTALSRQV